METFDMVPGREYVYRGMHVIYKRMRYRWYEFERIPDGLFIRISYREKESALSPV